MSVSKPPSKGPDDSAKHPVKVKETPRHQHTFEGANLDLMSDAATDIISSAPSDVLNRAPSAILQQPTASSADAGAGFVSLADRPRPHFRGLSFAGLPAHVATTPASLEAQPLTLTADQHGSTLPLATPQTILSAGHLTVAQRVALVPQIGQQYGNQRFQPLVAPHPTTAAATVRRYEAGEHAQFGAKEGEIEAIINIKGVPFTYGQVIALGDMFEDPAAIKKMSEPQLKELKKMIEDDRKYYEKEPGSRKPDEKPTEKAWNKATGGQYLKLAADNTSHFQGENLETWEKYHRQALQLACMGKMDEARLVNAFGDHFLTDAFSAGHLIPKQPVMDRAKKNVETGKNAPSFAAAVAIGMLNSKKGSELMRYEVACPPWAEWEPMSPGALTKVIEFIRMKIFPFKGDEEYYSTFAKMVHDRLNEDIDPNNKEGQHGVEKEGQHGVEVENARGDPPWRLSGDKTLYFSKDTLRITREAVGQSRRNLELVVSRNNPDYDPDQLFDYIDELVRGVLDYVPRPTAAGRKQIDEATKNFTDPTQKSTVEKSTVERFVNITIDESNYGLLIEKLQDKHLLRDKREANEKAHKDLEQHEREIRYGRPKF